MKDVSRRQLLAGVAAAGTAAALSPLGGPPVARAAVPPAGAQAPGFYRYKVGDYECTSINDGARSFPMPDKFVTNATKEEALAAADADPVVSKVVSNGGEKPREMASQTDAGREN